MMSGPREERVVPMLDRTQADSIFKGMVVYKFYFPMRDGFILEIILDQEKLKV